MIRTNEMLKCIGHKCKQVTTETKSCAVFTGEKRSTLNPVDRPLLHESRMQAVLDGERGNVQIVGSNETPRLVIK